MKKAKKVAPKRVKRAKSENKLYPGLPNYTGPDKGWFAFVHHGCLAEKSGDIGDRVRHVKTHKPKDERRIRLNHIMYLGPTLNRMLKLDMGAGDAILRESNRYGDLVMAYVKKHKPKHRWNGHTLTKANGAYMTG